MRINLWDRWDWPPVGVCLTLEGWRYDDRHCRLHGMRSLTADGLPTDMAGSGSIMIQPAPLGFSYSLDFGDMKHNAPRFGISVPTYRRVKWPDFPKYQAVGRWESEYSDPLEWRNDYPNPAFVRMTARDAFWAARIMAQFTPEELLAIVRTGWFSSGQVL